MPPEDQACIALCAAWERLNFFSSREVYPALGDAQVLEGWGTQQTLGWKAVTSAWVPTNLPRCFF